MGRNGEDMRSSSLIQVESENRDIENAWAIFA